MATFKSFKRLFCLFCIFTVSIVVIIGTNITAGAASTVVVAVEAFTVGGGFITYPTEVTVNMGDTGADILEKVLGKNKINKGNGIGNSEITSIAMEDTDYCVVEGDIGFYLDDLEIEYYDEVATDGWIANNDFVKDSAWTFILNNKRASTSLSNYVPQDGDVIRISFSLYKNGADLAIDSTIFPSTNRDSLYKHFAKLNENDYNIIEDVAIDLTMTQSDINEAVAVAKEELGSSASLPSTTTAPTASSPSGALTTKAPVQPPQGSGGFDKVDTAPTGVNHLMPIAIVLTAGAAMLLSRIKKKK